MHGWQANKKRTCAQPVLFRVIPENEIPRVSTRGFLFLYQKTRASRGFKEGFADALKKTGREKSGREKSGREKTGREKSEAIGKK